MTTLCYHSIQPGWRSPLAVDPVAFEDHCSWLAGQRAVLPLELAVARMNRRGALPHRCAVLTFDDGFQALYDYALPILRRHRFPATVFLVAQTLSEQGQPVDWVDTPPAFPLSTLTIEQVREMREAGVSFQSHSWAHHDMTQLTYDECVIDLRTSREFLEDLLHVPVNMLAYPRGRHTAMVRRAAERAGYLHAFSLPEGPEPVGAYSLPRVGIFDGNGRSTLRVKCSRPYLQLRMSPGFPLLDRLRRSAFPLRQRRRGPEQAGG